LILHTLVCIIIGLRKYKQGNTAVSNFWSCKLPEKSDMRIWQHFSASGPFKTNPQLLLKKNKWHTVNKLICEGLKLNSRRHNGFKECVCENTTLSVTNFREESFSDSKCIAGIYIHGI
jgi:hypothetical protein